MDLPALADAPAWGYDYQYPLPDDYLALVQVNDIYVRSGSSVALWSVEAGAILTNIEAPLKVRYVKRVTNPGLFDSMFCEALACKLALEACETLTQSETKYNRVAEKAQGMGLVKQEDANIQQYVTRKSLDGLYFMIGEEEKKIRQDPIGTGSAVLKKVFGALK